MSDDQDGCEWVNVSSGTVPTQIVPDKRPLNGSVCVCVCVCFDTTVGWASTFKN